MVTFFRSINTEELKSIILSDGKLKPKPKKKKKKKSAGTGVAGEYGITENEAYAKDVMMFEKQLDKDGEFPRGVSSVDDVKYSILIKFEVKQSTLNMICEEKGRRAKGQVGHNMDLREDEEGLRNVAVYKLEEIGIDGAPEGNINIIFKSNPDLGSQDVLAILNEGIVSMEITGSFITRRSLKGKINSFG